MMCAGWSCRFRALVMGPYLCTATLLPFLLLLLTLSAIAAARRQQEQCTLADFADHAAAGDAGDAGEDDGEGIPVDIAPMWDAANQGCPPGSLRGHVLKTDDIADRSTLVVVHYFAGWYPGPWSHWLYPTEPLAQRKSWVPDFPGRIPLGGNYTTDLSTVEADLIAADQYGVDAFEVLWSDPVVVGGGSSCNGGHNPADPNLHPCVDIGLAWMLNTSVWSELTRGLHFFVSYSTDFDGPGTGAQGLFVGAAGQKRWESYCATWIRAMRHPRHLKVDGRPLFKILGPSHFLGTQCSGNATLAQQRIDQFRRLAHAAGVGNPIIGGGWVTGAQPMPSKVYQGVEYDYTGVYGWVDPEVGRCSDAANKVYPYTKMDEWTNGRNWGNHSADAVPYCPNVMASRDARPAMEKGCAFAFPTKTEWVATLRRAKMIVEKPGARLGYPSSTAPDGVQPAITIYSWNEYQEGGIVAPTEGDKYLKLEGIRDVFGRSGKRLSLKSDNVVGVPSPRFHWPLARNASDVAGANDMQCQTLPGYPCPSFKSTGSMFPGQNTAAFFPQGDVQPNGGYWKGGNGLRTTHPVNLTRNRAYTVWWRTTFLPPAPPSYNIDQDQIFGATNNGTGQSWYLTFWNASRGTLPPEVCGSGRPLPMCGPLLSFVFAVQNANFIQYCTDPRTFEVGVNETHFVGFSSSGIDNSSFVFFFDGVDRSKELVQCAVRGNPAKNDPTGLVLPLRAGIAGAAKCGGGGMGCDRYAGFIGSTRYYNHSITAAQMKAIYDVERQSHLESALTSMTFKSDDITCDWRLVEQNAFSGWGAQLRSIGFSENRSICISGGHFGDAADDDQRFLTYNRSTISKIVQANVLPAIGQRDYTGLIVMDLERIAAPSKFGLYNSTLLQQVVRAIMLRISVTRDVFPLAKLAIYGTGISSSAQLRGFERAGAFGLWSALDYLVPSFYLSTINGTNSNEGMGVKAAPNASAVRLEVESQLRLTTAFAQRYRPIKGLAPFLSWLYEGREDREQNCAVPLILQRAVIAAVSHANATKMIQFWTGNDFETTSRHCDGSMRGQAVTQLQYLQRTKFVPSSCLHNTTRGVFA